MAFALSAGAYLWGTGYALAVEVGQLKWKFETGWKVSSSPAIGANGTIYVGGDKYVYALDEENGAKKWLFKREGIHNFSTPTIDSNGTVYICEWSKIYARHGNTGAKLWDKDLYVRSQKPSVGAVEQFMFLPVM